jgi:iron complex outermembrane receptor protein
MNKKLVAMSALSLVYFMSFVQTSYAEDAQAAEPAAAAVAGTEVNTASPSATPSEPVKTEAPVAEAGKGGVTKKMLGEVIVTSTTIDDRFDSKRGEASNISNISGKKVDEEHGKNIVDVLESVPGVTAEVQSGDSVKIMLRGVEAQRYMGEKPGVAIVIDGVPVLERTGRVNIDLDNIDSIKVIKGGASYLFGEDALSGAVIITTKRGAKMAGYTASAESGSFGYRKGLARVGVAKSAWVGHIQASKAYADDFYDQGEYSRRYYDGKLQYLINETSDVSIGFENSKRMKDSHGTVTGMTNALLDPRSVGGGKDYARHYDVDLNKLNATYSNDMGENSNLLVTTYLYKDHTFGWQNPSGYLRDASGVLLAGVNNMSLLRDSYATGRDTNQTQKGVKSEWRRGGKQVGVMAGLDIQQFEDRAITTNLVTYTSRSGAVNNTQFLPSGLPNPAFNPLNLAGAVVENSVSTTATRAVYGEAKLQLTDPLALTLNGRYDHLAVGYDSYIPLTGTGKITSGSKTFNVLSERIGLNYLLSNESEIYSNISNGFRTPTSTQLYGSTISPTGVVASNPDLKPEKAWNKEIGVRGKHEVVGIMLDMDVAIYQIDRRDFILNTGGQYQTSPSGTTEQYQNIGGVRNRGLEAGFKTDGKAQLSADLAYTYLNAVYTRYDDYWMSMGNRGSLPSVHYNNTGNTVPRSPRHRLNVNAKYRYTEALTFATEANAQSGSYADDVNVVWVGGRTVYNLMANYEIKRESGTKISLFARLDNLFNRYYYSTIRGSSDSNGDGVYNREDPSIVVNPGRVWTIGLTAVF